ncbi:MAG: hypothetical protein A2201_09065 [Alicyclobacillus sp. RIFOXYA1_FULL_53_8]|nr:MAG: hypothetical protein A2201_09065 [Alicyclobacillus sp. RIFOXYA1_FULL_53_8]
MLHGFFHWLGFVIAYGSIVLGLSMIMIRLYYSLQKRPKNFKFNNRTIVGFIGAGISLLIAITHL